MSRCQYFTGTPCFPVDYQTGRRDDAGCSELIPVGDDFDQAIQAELIDDCHRMSREQGAFRTSGSDDLNLHGHVALSVCLCRPSMSCRALTRALPTLSSTSTRSCPSPSRTLPTARLRVVGCASPRLRTSAPSDRPRSFDPPRFRRPCVSPRPGNVRQRSFDFRKAFGFPTR